jgi:hypothetical protein
LKKVLAQQSGLDPASQKLLFRGKEKHDSELLHTSGIKDMARLILLEAPTSQEQCPAEEKMDPEVARACEAIARVRVEVDKLANKVYWHSEQISESFFNSCANASSKINVVIEIPLVYHQN